MIIPVCKDINPSFLNTVRENCNTLKEVEQIYRYGIDRLKEEVISEENGETLIDIQKTLAAPAPYALYSRSYGPMVLTPRKSRIFLKAATPFPANNSRQKNTYLRKVGSTGGCSIS